jgi:hypothetical protein
MNSKNENPRNVLQASPIENFSGCLCQKVCEGGWKQKAKPIDSAYKSKIKEFGWNF